VNAENGEEKESSKKAKISAFFFKLSNHDKLRFCILDQIEVQQR
jgi:hypothetical protein